MIVGGVQLAKGGTAEPRTRVQEPATAATATAGEPRRLVRRQTRLDTSRVSLGEMVAAAGGLVLLVCMFLPWFDGERTGRGGTAVPIPTSTGWESFGGVFDILIVLLAGFPIAVAVWRASDSLPPLPAEQGALVLVAGAILFLVVAARLIDPPGLINVEIPGLEIDTNRRLAAVLALLAAAAIAVGGHLQRSVRRVGFEPTSP